MNIVFLYSLLNDCTLSCILYSTIVVYMYIVHAYTTASAYIKNILMVTMKFC